MTTDVFIITGDWVDSHGKNYLRFFGTSKDCGTVEIIIGNNKPVFFLNRDEIIEGIKYYKRKNVKFKSFDKQPVDAIYFNSQRDLKIAVEDLKSKSIKTYESDVDPARRYLMEKYINVQIKVTGDIKQKEGYISFINPLIEPCDVNPDFKVASLDIETGMKNSVLYSIAINLTWKNNIEQIVFILGSEQKKLKENIFEFPSEKELLEEFLKWFKKSDPDIIIGWHVIGFDLMFLENKSKELFIPFELARGRGKVTLRNRGAGSYYANIPGRVVIDGPPALRSSFFSFEDYKLETIAQELLGIGKEITPDQNKIKEIERLFAEDKISLAKYNLQDAVLVTDIFRKTALIELSVKRSQISGLLMDQLGMMSAAFDHFYLPRLHKEGFVAPNIADIITGEHAAGGYVLDPKPGIYDDVIVLDFKSLYPSIIQTFKIDPLSKLLSAKDTINTPNGINFSFTKHLLPDFIETLMQQRADAKKKKDKQLAQAIKILMNSFYGVMGSYNCRFYQPELATAITGTGQWLLLGSKAFLEANNYKVVYGDTDSLFVRLKPHEGENAEENGLSIADSLNTYWKERLKKEYKVDSFLEIEYEKYYRKYIITPARGSETSGAKKRYAGLLIEDNKERIEFVGMEFVRSDWTKLSKEFQIELYDRIFHNKEIEEWIKDVVKKLKSGELDETLIYKKRLRKDTDDYVKNIPQHVKAAKMIDQHTGTIHYVITRRGPVPVELNYNDIDYEHYIEKQLKPIADSVLVLLGKSFENIIQSGQLSIF